MERRAYPSDLSDAEYACLAAYLPSPQPRGRPWRWRLRAILDGIFDDRVFTVSFLSNVVVAALIVFLGDHLGVGAQLSTGVVVVLGIRIFSNAAAIRRHLFKA